MYLNSLFNSLVSFNSLPHLTPWSKGLLIANFLFTASINSMPAIAQEAQMGMKISRELFEAKRYVLDCIFKIISLTIFCSRFWWRIGNRKSTREGSGKKANIQTVTIWEQFKINIQERDSDACLTATLSRHSNHCEKQACCVYYSSCTLYLSKDSLHARWIKYSSAISATRNSQKLVISGGTDTAITMMNYISVMSAAKCLILLKILSDTA